MGNFDWEYNDLDIEDVIRFINNCVSWEKEELLNVFFPTMYDQMKWETFNEASKKYTLEELQEKLK